MEMPWIRFGRGPCVMILLLSIGLLNHVIVAPVVLQTSGRDAWLSILLCAALLPLWLPLLFRIVRSVGTRTFGEWLKPRTGTVGAAIVMGFVGLILLMKAIITAVDTVTWSSVTYLPQTPKMVTALVFLALCVAGCVLGMHVIAYMSCILLPVVSLLGVFVATANTAKKDYSQLLPIGENGWSPIAHGMLYVGSGFIELFSFILLAGYVDRPFKLRHLFMSGAFIAMLCFGPVVGALTEFGPSEAMTLRYPAFAQWRLVQIGKYIEHLDFFAIYQWLSGAFVRTSASICLVIDMLNVRDRRARAVIAGVVGAAVLALSAVPFGDDTQYRFLSIYYLWSFVLTAALFGYLLLIASFAAKREEETADA